MKDAAEEEGEGEEKGGEKVRRRDGREAAGENKRGLGRAEMTPGETHLPHQSWRLCLNVVGVGWTTSRKRL